MYLHWIRYSECDIQCTLYIHLTHRCMNFTHFTANTFGWEGSASMAFEGYDPTHLDQASMAFWRVWPFPLAVCKYIVSWTSWVTCVHSGTGSFLLYISLIHILILSMLSYRLHILQVLQYSVCVLLQRSWTYHCEGILPCLWRAFGPSFTCNRGHIYYMSSATWFVKYGR